MYSPMFYMWLDGEVVGTNDVEEFARWWRSAEQGTLRRVAKTIITPEIYVSTVFLAMDHNFRPGGPPILWETMVFESGESVYCDRYSSREDAQFGHGRAVSWAEAKLAHREEREEYGPPPFAAALPHAIEIVRRQREG